MECCEERGPNECPKRLRTLYSAAAMSTLAPPFFLLFWLLRLASTAFPEEPGPLNFISTEVVHRYPVFLGRPHRSSLRQEPLHIQRVLKVNRTLYIGARDDLFRVELDNVAGDEMFYSKKRTWESNKNDIRTCRMKGKHEVQPSLQTWPPRKTFQLRCVPSQNGGEW